MKAMADSLVPVEGSERPRAGDAGTVGRVDEAESLTVTVYVRPDPAPAERLDVAAEAEKLPAERRYLSPDELAEQFGASPADLDAVAEFARERGLEVLSRDPAARSLRLRGSAGAMSRAFGVRLVHREHAGGRFRGHEGPVRVPASLRGIVEAVLGLDNRPLGRPYVRHTAEIDFGDLGEISPGALQLPANTYLPPQVAELYGFPAAYDGRGQTVAVFVFNGALGSTGKSAPGGYDAALLEGYFAKVLGRPAPEVVDVVVHGPGNQPSDGTNPDDVSGEAYLDLCLTGALAPGARIAVYFTEFTEQGWVDALNAAVTDTANDPSVISISYGNAEDGAGHGLWTPMAVQQVNRALQSAAAAGRTVTAAAGDSGARDESAGSARHADFPASSPWVLGCGGTHLEAAGGVIERETVWNQLAIGYGATGGGVSKVFPLPSWQDQAGVPRRGRAGSAGRGVPDVAAVADPKTPFVIVKPNGKVGGAGGTSAAAPLWAALVARLNQALKARCGFLNPVLYTRCATGVLRDITEGDNGGFAASPGWDPCTGLGCPGAGALLEALSGHSPA